MFGMIAAYFAGRSAGRDRAQAEELSRSSRRVRHDPRETPNPGVMIVVGIAVVILLLIAL